jgi:delta 1-pyrroline-5-carboxylate dehydrogenase
VIDPGDDLAIMREEIFGPVLPIKTYRGLEQAIDYVNSHPRPLALYYFGADPGKRDEVLRRTISGGASINTTLFHFVAENLPFGGVGASGIGAYHGEFGFPDLLASQRRIPAKPSQRLALPASAIRASHRSDAEISQTRLTPRPAKTEAGAIRRGARPERPVATGAASCRNGHGKLCRNATGR